MNMIEIIDSKISGYMLQLQIMAARNANNKDDNRDFDDHRLNQVTARLDVLRNWKNNYVRLQNERDARLKRSAEIYRQQLADRGEEFRDTTVVSLRRQ